MAEKKRYGTVKLVGAAAFAGMLVGVLAVYGMSLLDGNDAGSRGQAMGPLATGEVAAFMVAETPQPAPGLAFVDANGAERTLEDWRGRTVLLNLWATWCAPCRAEMPSLDALQQAMGGEAFEVVAVSIDRERAVAEAFLAEIGIETLAFYHDASSGVLQALQRAGLAPGLPTTLIIGPDGEMLGHLPGPADWASPEAEALVRAAMDKPARRLAAPRTRERIGCDGPEFTAEGRMPLRTGAA